MKRPPTEAALLRSDTYKVEIVDFLFRDHHAGISAQLGAGRRQVPRRPLRGSEGFEIAGIQQPGRIAGVLSALKVEEKTPHGSCH